MTCCPTPAAAAVVISCADGILAPPAPTGAGGGMFGPSVGSRDATGGQGCCWGTVMGFKPIGTPTSMSAPIPMPEFGDVVEVEGENDDADIGSRWSSVRGRLGAGRPLLLLPPVVDVLLHPLSGSPAPSPSSPRSSSSIALPSLSSLLRLRPFSPSSICEDGSGCSSA